MKSFSHIFLEYELHSRWDPREREEVRSHHAKLWDEWKCRLSMEFGIKGGHRCTHLADIPGFLDSLKRLAATGYSLVDIAVMFGLTRQRIDQLFDDHDIPRGNWGSSFRMWSDEKNYFVAVTHEDLGELLRGKRNLTLEGQKAERRERKKQRHIQAILEFAREHGRPPSITELAKKLGYSRLAGQAIIARYWGYQNWRPGSVSYQEAWDNLYAAAGFPDRPNRLKKYNHRTNSNVS